MYLWRENADTDTHDLSLLSGIGQGGGNPDWSAMSLVLGDESCADFAFESTWTWVEKVESS